MENLTIGSINYLDLGVPLLYALVYAILKSRKAHKLAVKNNRSLLNLVK